jgi:hypothetical protein
MLWKTKGVKVTLPSTGNLAWIILDLASAQNFANGQGIVVYQIKGFCRRRLRLVRRLPDESRAIPVQGTAPLGTKRPGEKKPSSPDIASYKLYYVNL